MTRRLKNGRWVLFTPSTPPSLDLMSAVHKSKSGHCVGIYQTPGIDSTGGFTPERIMAVRPDGTNVSYYDPSSDPPVKTLSFYVQQVSHLSVLEDRADIPPGRVVSESWTPKA